MHFTRGDEPVTLSPTHTEKRGDVVRQIWEERDIPKERFEEGAPPGHAQLMARVRLTRWSDAKGPQSGFEGPVALSAFLAELMAQPEDVQELSLQARELLAGLEDAPARVKAERLHAFVAQEIRYCAISLGIHGWKPYAPSAVLATRAGDCKDKAGLLKALLAHSGIPSRVAVLYSHDGHPRPFFVPTVAGNQNHAILLVDLPEGTVPVDPTEPHVPFGQLPPRDQGAELLPVTSPGSPLWRSPEDAPEAQHEEQRFRLRLAADGQVTGDFTARANGTSASSLRGRLRGASERHRREAIGRLARAAPREGHARDRQRGATPRPGDLGGGTTRGGDLPARSREHTPLPRLGTAATVLPRAGCGRSGRSLAPSATPSAVTTRSTSSCLRAFAPTCPSRAR